MSARTPVVPCTRSSPGPRGDRRTRRAAPASAPFTFPSAIAMVLTACGGGAPPGFDAPDSALHDAQADVYLVSNVRGGPVAKDGNGYIARQQPEDESMQRYWIEGGQNGVTLHAPKGMALRGDELWVADIDTLRSFDRRTGEPRRSVEVPGATYLNDVAVAPDGVLYVTDSGLDGNHAATGTDAIWRLPPEATEPEELVRGLELGQPSGLVALARGLYVVSWRDGTFYQVDYRGVRTELATAPTAALDGLVRVEARGSGDAPGWHATSWVGQCVYRFDMTGGVTRLPGNYRSPGDLGFDAVRRRLLVPLFQADRLALLRL